MNPYIDFKKGDRPLNKEIDNITKLVEIGKIVEIVKSEIDLN